MGIITELTVPGEDFELGPSLAAAGDVHVTFERVVPADDRLFPFMWVTTEASEAVARLLRANPAVEELEEIHRDGNRTLYDVTWSEATDRFLACVRESDPVVLGAGGSGDRWEFELRFADQDAVALFQQVCNERDISITVESVLTSSVADTGTEKLSEPQRRTVQLALEKGYFDVPRKTTLGELAAELDVSDQAVSARLRRSMKTLSQQLLVPEDEDSKRR